MSVRSASLPLDLARLAAAHELLLGDIRMSDQKR